MQAIKLQGAKGVQATAEKFSEFFGGGEACHTVRDFIAHFANPLRLRILCTLASRKASVTELVETTGARQPTVSQQLNLLRLAGIVTRNREGNRSVYEIADPLALEMMGFIFGLAEKLIARGETNGTVSNQAGSSRAPGH